MICQKEIYENCPNCDAETTGIVLSTAWTIIYPAHCCNSFCYEVQDNDFEDLFDP